MPSRLVGGKADAFGGKLGGGMELVVLKSML